jgi:hypothetical protein
MFGHGRHGKPRRSESGRRLGSAGWLGGHGTARRGERWLGRACLGLVRLVLRVGRGRPGWSWCVLARHGLVRRGLVGQARCG